MGNSSIKELFNKIDFYKRVLDEEKPFAQGMLKELQQYYRLSLTYSSNALEGNSLTLSETKVAIEDGLTVAGKPVKDYYEALGHATAFDFMYNMALNKDPALTEENIRELHRLFHRAIDGDRAGNYRTVQNYISGTDYIPPSPEEVPALIKDFVQCGVENKEKLHPIEFAALAHIKLVDIHPFLDGNGRTARLLMNLCLMKDGYNIISIPPALRHDYIQALQISQRDKNPTTQPFVKLIAECELESQRDYFRLIKMPFPKYSGE